MDMQQQQARFSSITEESVTSPIGLRPYHHHQAWEAFPAPSHSLPGEAAHLIKLHFWA